jgi:hypothetical protein
MALLLQASTKEQMNALADSSIMLPEANTCFQLSYQLPLKGIIGQYPTGDSYL